MKKRAKIIIIALVAATLIVLLFPVKIRHKEDGGTVEYKAIVYTVTKLHAPTGPNEYIGGTVIELFGREIYRSEEKFYEDRGDTVAGSDPADTGSNVDPAATQPGTPRDSGTSLRFWILDKFGDSDSEGMQRTSMMGGREYVEDKYPVVTDEGGYNPRAPEVYVSYVVTPWPDYADGENGFFVTRINIADPEVGVFGVTMNSTQEEFILQMEKNGLTVVTAYEDDPGWSPENPRFALVAFSPNGEYEIRLSRSADGNVIFYIDAPVSNRDNIVF